jgi:hypothetical protein
VAEPVINIPRWEGVVQQCGLLWELKKGTHLAVCALYTHPYGGEVRIDVDGELLRSHAGRNGIELVDLGLEWKQQFSEKGWIACT